MSEDTIVAAPPAAAPPPDPSRRTVGDWIRFYLRGIGQTLITLGVVVLLFVVYEVWITNIFAHIAQEKVYNALEKEWRNGQDPLLALPGQKNPAIPLGTGIAVLYMPRLGRDYHFAIVQGSPVPDQGQLEKGPAHYGDTQMPGQLGNFAVAGHRVGKGEPFLNIDHLRSGDALIVETKTWWYVYDVLGTPIGADPQQDQPASVPTAEGPVQVPGREVVDPSDGNVLLPVPNHPEIPVTDAKAALMTLTTCTPKFTANQRMIVHATLVTKLPNTEHYIKTVTMPKSLLALYDEVNA